MLSATEEPEALPRRWSWKKTLLVFLLPPVLFFGGILLYDERLEPYEDLKAKPMPPVIPAENGYDLLAVSWAVDLKRWPDATKRLRETRSGKYLWEESLVIGLNPTGRDLQLELKQALGAKEWRAPEPDPSGGGARYIYHEVPVAALTAEVLLENQMGYAGPAMDLIQDLRRMAGRQLSSPLSWGGFVSGFYISGLAADLTYSVADKVIEARELMELAGIWDGEDLNRESLLNMLPGDVAMADSEFDEQVAYEFSPYRRLMTKKNQTRNWIHRGYRLFAKGALEL